MQHITKESLITQVGSEKPASVNKITVVGTGQVGMAVAACLLTQNVTLDICLLDLNESYLRGEVMDLQHGATFINDAKISGGLDFSLSANSSIIVITAGARQKQGETRLMLVQRNTDIIKSLIPKLMEYNPNPILVLVTNPVDIMTFLAWKFSGLPKHRVLGTGTSLDSSRFRTFISERTGVAPTSIQSWIIGEHGDSSVPVWSGVTVGGARLIDLNPCIGTEEDPEKWNELHQKVIRGAYEVINLKGYTSWAIGLTTSAICGAILRNTDEIYPVSTSIYGKYDICKEVFLSVPAVLNANGVSHIVNLKLSKTESEMLKKSAETISDIQVNIKY